MKFYSTKRIVGGMVPAFTMVAMLVLAGCATGGPFGNGNRGGYNNDYGARVGTVQSVRQVYIQDDNSANILGTVIGAVAGGILGNQVGDGDGQKVATVAGAVAGGYIGHKIADKDGPGRSPAYRIVVQLDDGRIATVTQQEAPRVDRGDRVRVNNDHVYLL